MMMMVMIMTPQKLLLFSLLMVIIGTTLSHTESAETLLTRHQRSTANLEYVMTVLAEQGRLDEVDGDLLRRIQTTILQNKGQRESRTQSESERNVVNQVSSTHRVSVIDRARTRQQKLFGVRGQNRSPILDSKRGSTRNKLVGGECQALIIENSILKQQLLSAQSQQQQLLDTQSQQQLEARRGLELDGPVRALHLLNRIQEDSFPASPILQQQAPLDKLFQAASQEEEEGTKDQFGNLLSRILITPTPTISTILDTTSFFTTVTVTLTREINIFFHGKKLPTSILETEVQVQTVTSTLSRTMEITPTPTWQTVTITPTVTQPPPSPAPAGQDINALLAQQRKEQERKALIDKIKSLNNPRPEEVRSIGGVKAEVVEIPKVLDSFESLQKYVEYIRKLKQENTPTIKAEPLIAIPTTSVSTVFMSGSIPGEYSTSLITITLDENGNQLERRKRQVSPSSAQTVVATRLAVVGGDTLEDLSEVEILSSFRVDSGTGDKPRKALEECGDNTVTVTVTHTRTCLP